MKFLENYYYYNKEDIKRIKNNIKDILDSFYLEYIFDYKMTRFEIDIDKDIEKIKISIFGFGNPYIDKEFKKEDALLKMIFEKKRNKWKLKKVIKSNVFKMVKNRDTEVKLSNLNIIKIEILKYLNN